MIVLVKVQYPTSGTTTTLGMVDIPDIETFEEAEAYLARLWSRWSMLIAGIKKHEGKVVSPLQFIEFLCNMPAGIKEVDYDTVTLDGEA
jgi:hypothetical protein